MSDLQIPHILVTTTARDEVSADRADLFISIRGNTFFSGEIALKRAREVAQLVSDLMGLSITEEQIHLLGVRAETMTGTFTKSSSVLYDLRIQCPRLSLLPDVLGVITSQKNTELTGIQWLFPDGESTRDRLVDSCIAEANRRARRMAEGFGVRLLGVGRVEDTDNMSEFIGTFVTRKADGNSDFGRSRARRIDDSTFGIELAHTRTLIVKLTVHFLVSPSIR